MKAVVKILTGGEPAIEIAAENTAEIAVMDRLLRINAQVCLLNYGGNTREGRLSMTIGAREIIKRKR